MKKNILGIATLLLIVLSACAATKKKGSKTRKNTTKISSIEFHRTMCYGKCPDYRLRMMADGSAMYVGRKFADMQGTYEKKLSAEKVQALFKDFERFRVDTCGETYETIPDLPGLDYEIVYSSGREQNIKNSGSPFAPKFLRGLAQQMDSLAHVDNTWKKTESWTEPR